MLKPQNRNVIPEGLRIGNAHLVRRGEPDANARLFLSVGTHGQEFAPVLALASFLKEDWRWPDVALLAVFSDPVGYDEEGYGFISATGKESCWPPLWGYHMNKERYWAYYDRNSSWGTLCERSLSPSHCIERGAMNDFAPTYCLSLHETVWSEVERHPFWTGSGILTIEALELSRAEIAAMACGTGNPLGNPLAWAASTLLGWLGSIVGQPAWALRAKALKENAHYKLNTKIVGRFQELGGEMCGRKWVRYLDLLGQPTIGEGREIHDPARMASEWWTVTDYALVNFGAPGLTTESFPTAELGLRGVEHRAEQQKLFITATLDILQQEAENESS